MTNFPVQKSKQSYQQHSLPQENTAQNSLPELRRMEQEDLSTAVETYLQNFLSSNTRATYEGDFRHFAKFLSATAGNLSHPREIRMENIIAYRDELRLHYAPNTVNRKLSAASSLMSELRNAQIIPTNPADGVKRLPSRVRKERLGFTDQEVTQLLSAYPDDSVHSLQRRALLQFLFFTGARISETLNVRVSDISPYGNVGLVVIQGKGNKLRILPLHPRLYKTLRELISRMNKEPGTHLFTRRKGDRKARITRQAAHMFLKKTLRFLGLESNRTLHSSRRTVISNLLENGARIELVSELAGHANINTTLLYNVRREPIKNSPLLTLNYQ